MQKKEKIPYEKTVLCETYLFKRTIKLVYCKDPLSIKLNATFLNTIFECFFSASCEVTDVVDCSSTNNAYQACMLPRSGYMITKIASKIDHSDGKCLNNAYGFTKSLVWVTDGCNAEFSLCLMKGKKIYFEI